MIFLDTVIHFWAGERALTERAGRRMNMCTGKFGWERRGWDYGGGTSYGAHECQRARERQFAL